MNELRTVPLLDISVSSPVDADVAAVYCYITDLTRSGEWSPECLGGEWLSGGPAIQGAIFRGRNYRRIDAVAWAPVVRGEWFTEAEVVTAQPNTQFSWAMRDSSGRTQESVWSFRLADTAYGTVLTHEFVMRSATEGMLKILAELTSADQCRFIREWQSKLEVDMRATLAAVKANIEGERSE
jgi:hypothetical protein